MKHVSDLPLDPPDTSVEEAQAEQEMADGWATYRDDGWLPGGRDPGHVEELASERDPEALHALTVAETDHELLEVAKRIRETLRGVVDDMIRGDC
jgi:hypothetical protein